MKLYDTCIKAFVMGNLGDDLFIYTLCKRYQNNRFILCGEHKYKEVFANLTNLTYISTDSILIKWIFRIKKLPAWFYNFVNKRLRRENCKALRGCYEWFSKYSERNILISGSIFMQLHEDRFFQNPYYLGEIEYYRRHPYIIGCNFGPYINDEYREFYEKCFYQASQVTFRDRYSDGLFPKDCTSWAPDILFTFDKSYIKKPKVENYVAISVINLNKDGEKDDEKAASYEKAIAELVCYLQEIGKKVVLLGFCKAQGDDEVIDGIVNRLPSKNGVSSYCYPQVCADEIVGFLACAETVVASRFHAMVLGWVFEKITVPIVYSEKMTNTILCVNPDISVITTEEIKNNSKNLTEIYQECLDKKIDIDVVELREKAQRHFEMLDVIYG